MKKRRRAYEVSELEIEPYSKKPKIATLSISPSQKIRSLKHPESLTNARYLDLLWMIDLYIAPSVTPMWIGWNSIFSAENSEVIQKVWYLPQINESPTSTAVVAETLNRAQRIASECGKEFISVIYDLAIGKIALKIQATESPKYDNVFVNLGTFHIEMAFFSAICKVYCKSGGPHLLHQSRILEKG